MEGFALVRLTCFVSLVLSAVLLAAPAAAQDGGIRVDVVGDSVTSLTTMRVTGTSNVPASTLQRERLGRNFSYVISGLPVGESVQIELGFAEWAVRGPGERIFSVEVNGEPFLEDFDIFADAGQTGRAVVKRTTAAAPSGSLDILFRGTRGDAKVGYIRLRSSTVNALIVPEKPEEPAPAATPVPTPRVASVSPAAPVPPPPPPPELTGPGFPLGGVGTGKIEMHATGAFLGLTTANPLAPGSVPLRGTFLAVSAKSASGRGSARVLRLADAGPRFDYTGATPVQSGAHAVQFPFGEWEFRDEQLPIRAGVTAFSPLVPGRAADSSLPAAVLLVELENPNRFPVSAGVTLAFEDPESGAPAPVAGLRPEDLAGGRVQTEITTTGLYGISMSGGPRLDGTTVTPRTEFFIGTPTRLATVTRSLRWSAPAKDLPWWKKFSTTMRLDPRAPSLRGAQPAQPARRGQQAQPREVVVPSGAFTGAALCSAVNLSPGEKREVPFVISWYIPAPAPSATAASRPYYVRRFESAAEAGFTVLRRGRALQRETESWQTLLRETSISPAVQVALSRSLQNLTVQSLFTDGGGYSDFERLGDASLLVGGLRGRALRQAPHALLLPDLERRQLELYAATQREDGLIPAALYDLGATVPAERRGQPVYDDGPEANAAWLLGVLGYYRSTGDREFLEHVYAPVLRAGDYLVKSADAASPWREAGLDAASGIARDMGDMDLAADYRAGAPEEGRPGGSAVPAAASLAEDDELNYLRARAFLPDSARFLTFGELAQDLVDRSLVSTASPKQTGEDLRDTGDWRLLMALPGVRFDVARGLLLVEPTIPPDVRDRVLLPVMTPAFTGVLEYDAVSRIAVLSIRRVARGQTPVVLREAARTIGPGGRLEDETVLPYDIPLRAGMELEFRL